MSEQECAWPLPVVEKNTDGRAGRNKVTVGQGFGRLQVVEILSAIASANKTKECRCICSCGNEKITNITYVNVGETKSCGCLKADTNVERCTTHGQSPASGPTKTYMLWASMVGRCTNDRNPKYADYGGRGITVCDRWLKFDNFLQDMGEKPNSLSLERVDNDIGYCPENCKWATIAEQNHNKRNNTLSWDIVREIRASDLGYKELAERFNIYHSTIGKVFRNEIWVDPDYQPTKRKSGVKPRV